MNRFTAASSTTGLAAIAVGALFLAHAPANATPATHTTVPAHVSAYELTKSNLHVDAIVTRERRQIRHQWRERKDARHRRDERRDERQEHRREHSMTVAESAGSPQAIAESMLAQRGESSQWTCLDELWDRESGWQVTAENASGAYGIPQALPGSKMASAGADWQTDAATQIRWGLDYISETYGSPCGALAHSNEYGYY